MKMKIEPIQTDSRWPRFTTASEKAEGEGACCFFSPGNVVVKKEVHFATATAELDSRNHRGTFLLRLFQPRECTGFVLDSRLGNIESADVFSLRK